MTGSQRAARAAVASGVSAAACSPRIAERSPLGALFVEQMRSQRMRREPARGHRERDASRDLKLDARQVDRRARMVEQHRQAQREQLRPYLVVAKRRLNLGQSATTSKNEQRKATLLSGGKSGHVGMLQDIRTVLVKPQVRDRHT